MKRRKQKGRMNKCEKRKRLLVDEKNVIKGKRQTTEGEQRKGEGEGSLKGHHLACSKWQ